MSALQSRRCAGGPGLGHAAGLPAHLCAPRCAGRGRGQRLLGWVLPEAAALLRVQVLVAQRQPTGRR